MKPSREVVQVRLKLISARNSFLSCQRTPEKAAHFLNVMAKCRERLAELGASE